MADAAPPLAGVLGWPVGHSLSPALHGHWLSRYALAGHYVALPVHPDRLGEAIRGLAALAFAGANVTVPHKEAVAKLADTRSDTVTRIGAANTLVIGADGAISADSTDGYGFLANLDVGAPGWPADRPAVIIGAGGAARAIVDALQSRGCPEIRLVNRTRERAEAVMGDLAGPSALRVIDWDRRRDALDGAGVLVNTTTQGMAGQPPLDLALDSLPADAVVNDIVYTPLETPLLKDARARSIAAVDGLGMLLHQAVPGFQAWFGVRPAVDEAARAVVLAALSTKG